MRPIRLELSGFTAFHSPTVVDFAGLELFAITGPVGSGKSSLVDAIGFALFGAVPRWEDARKVEPAITKGLQEARVRFDFTLGETPYCAVRVVRRTPKGATTKEARLESGETVLAGNEREVTEEVEKRLGLTFKDFCKSVVLPQGEFARFLRDKPSDRQDLLVRLLDLGIYAEVGRRAGERSRRAGEEAHRLNQRLTEELGFATQAALASAQAEVAGLQELMAKVDEAAPLLSELRAQEAALRREAQEALTWVDALSQAAVPGDAAELGARSSAAEQACASAEDAYRQAQRLAEEKSEHMRAMPELRPLETALSAHEKLGELGARSAGAEAMLKQAAGESGAASDALRDLESQVADARAALEAAQRSHSAHVLAGGLSVGDPCPVCAQKVVALPALEVPEALDECERRARQADEALPAARARESAAAKALAGAEERLRSVGAEMEALRPLAGEHPDPEAIRASIAAIEAARSEKERFDSAEREAGRRAQDARAALEEARGALTQAWSALDRLRDTLSPLRPPPAGRLDLAADWESIAGWASDQAAVQQERAAKLLGSAEAAADKHTEHVDLLLSACERLGLATTPGGMRDAVFTGLVNAQVKVEGIQKGLAEIEEARSRLAEQRRKEQVAKRLYEHLKANAFEKWLLQEAMERLSHGATAMLKELSGGAYSLSFGSSGEFCVIDHANADQERPAWTLSGGETFLAALSLSLALAEHLSEMSAAGALRLDSIFIDEGFGSLDEETLATVASSIEILGSKGRMVGIVTHRRELAERMPVRFEVSRQAGSSVVERVLH